MTIAPAPAPVSPAPAAGAPWYRELGRTGLRVSAVTAGGGPLGSMPGLFVREVPQDEGVETVLAVLGSDITTIDTANGYSYGESERRVGAGLAVAGGLGQGRLVITKVDPSGPDYSAARVRASVRESKERLGLEFLPLVHLHDPENFAFEDIAAPGGAVDALVALREAGEIGAIGLAGGPTQEMARYLALDVFDVLLVHNRWTLVDRSAAELLAYAHARGLGIVNAAVHGGGALVDHPVRPGRYAYREAVPETARAISAMRAACQRAGVPLAAAALQFSLRDPRVATTVVGMSRPARVAETIAMARADVPDSLWEELAVLLPSREAWIDHSR